MQNSEDRKWLYENLAKRGYDIGTQDEFERSLDENDDDAQWYHKKATEIGLQVGDYNDFDSLFRNKAPQPMFSATATPFKQNNSVAPTPSEKPEEEKVQLLFTTPQRPQLKSLQVEQKEYPTIAETTQKKMAEGVTQRQQLSDMTTNVQKALNRRGAELDEAQKANKQSYIPQGTAGSIPAFEAGRMYDPEYRDYAAAKESLQNAQAIIDAAGKEAEDKAKGHTGIGGFFKGALRGADESFGDINTWTAGLKDSSEGLALLKALDAAEEGTLTPSQQALLDAKAIELAVEQNYSSSLGRGYKAGQVTAESLPFMMEFAFNPIAGAGNTIANRFARYALNRFGKQAVTKNAGKYLAGKALSQVATDALKAGAISATTGAGRTAADALQRMQGDIYYQPNEEGKVAFWKREGGEDATTAFKKAYANTTIENFSEMLGNYFAPIGKAAGIGVSKGLSKIGLEGVNQMLRDVKANDLAQLVADFEKRAQWNGTIGEFGEEVAGNILNSIIVGDQTLDAQEGTGVFNKENLIDTYLGVALLGGGLSAAKTIDYPLYKYYSQKNIRNAQLDFDDAFGKDEEALKINEALTSDDPRIAGEALRNILGNDDFTQEQQETAAELATTVQKYKGAQLFYDKRQNDPETPIEEVEVAESYDNGRNLETPQEKNDAYNMYEYQAQNMRRIFGLDEDADVDAFIGDDPYLFATTRRNENPEDGQAVLDYLNAKATMDGLYDQVNDTIDQQIEQSNKIIDSRKNNDDAMIHPATMRLNDREVYIISGRIKNLEDGTIDTANSDESIIIMDAETGNREFTTAADIKQADAPIDAEQEKMLAAETITNTISDQAERDIEGVLPFNVGDPYTILDDQGVQHTVTIVADNGDGTVQMRMDNEQQDTTAKKDDVQAMFEAYNLNRLNTVVTAKKEQETKVAESSITPTSEQAVEQAEPKPRIPLDEQGEPMYEAAPVYDTWTELLELNEGNEEEAIDTANAMRENAQAELDKAMEAPKVKGKTVPEIQAAKAQQKALIKQAQDKLNYWTDVANYRDAQLELMKRAEQRAAIAKAQAASQEKGRYSEENTALGAPIDFRDYVMRSIATGGVRFIWKDSETGTRGLGSHTGLKSNEERNPRIWLLNNENGLYPEEAAEQLLTSYAEELGYTPNIDTSDALSEILDVVSSYATPSSMFEAAQARHAEINEQNIEQEAEDAYYRYKQAEAEANGMTLDEWLDYEEYVLSQDLLRFEENYDGIIAIFVEAAQVAETLNNNNNESSRDNEDVSRRVHQESGLSDGRETSVGVLQTEQMDNGIADSRGAEAGQGSDAQVVEPSTNDIPASEVSAGAEKVDNGYNGRSLTTDEAKAVVNAMQQNAIVVELLDLTPENWIAQFGEDGIIDTPIGNVKMGENQYFKLAQKGREGKLGMIKPTLQSPDIIVEEKSSAKNGQTAERNSSYVFVKAFTNTDGSRNYLFTSVTIRKDGKEVVISNQEKETPRIERLLKEGKLAYISEATLPSESTNSTQGNQSTILGGAILSESKDTTSEPQKQEVEQKNDDHRIVFDAFGKDYISQDGKNSFRITQIDGAKRVAIVNVNTEAVGADNLEMTFEEVANLFRNGQWTEATSTPQQVEDVDIVTIKKDKHTKTGEDLFVAKIKDRVSRDEYNRIKGVAKEHNGYYSTAKRGFIFKTESDAEAFRVATQVPSAQMEDAKEVSLTELREVGSATNDIVEPIPTSDTEPQWKYELTVYDNGSTILERSRVMPNGVPVYDANFDMRAANPREMLDILNNPSNNMQAVLEQVGSRLEQRATVWDFREKARTEGVNGYMIGDAVKYTYNGKQEVGTIYDFEDYGDHNPILDLGTAPVLYVSAQWDQVEKVNEQPTIEQPATVTPSGNKLVTDERYEELKRKMRQKLGGQMNMGIDPEILAIGTEMAVYHIEKGARKFADYASAMIADLGDMIRPYLKAFYNGARELPEVESAGYAAEMTTYDDVRTFDVSNFDKTAPNAMATAEIVIKEQDVSQQAEVAKDKIKNNRNKVRKTRNKSVSSSEVMDLFGTIEQTNTQEDDLRGDDAVRTEGLPADGSRQPLGLRESERGDRQGVGQKSGRLDGEGERSGSVQARTLSSGLLENPKNTRNNHAERGAVIAPYSVDARIEANIRAIELSQQLIANEQEATPEQMAVLRQFSGWGGLGKAFNNSTRATRMLQDLLGADAYQDAVMSANSAYYTPTYIVDTLWDIATQLGFKGGNILEGSAGIGNILGQMPADISQRSDIRAIEIDSTAGNILSLLYPDAQVDIQGFEQTHIPNGSIDLAITNVPFVTGLRVNDTSGDKDLSKKFHNIHDFCIAKNVRKLREGGIGIFITSNGTLDNSKKLREWVTNQGGADFIGAFRLNNKTFGGTSVTSDIVVVRKRVNGQVSPNAIDVTDVSGERTAEYNTGETRKVKGVETPIIKSLAMDYNKYFIDRPENMAGVMRFGFEEGDTYRPTSKGLYPIAGKDQSQMLQEFVQSFTPEAFTARHENGIQEDVDIAQLLDGKKLGEVFVDADKLYIADADGVHLLDVNSNKVKGHTKVECFNAYVAIKDAVKDVLDYQTQNAGDDGLQPLLDKLNKAYDSFVKTYGHFNKNTAIAFLRNDVDYPNVFSLEKYEEIGDGKGGRIQKYEKSDVFKKRVIEKEVEPRPSNIKDGIIASIFKYGRVDVPYIAEQLQQSEADVKNGIIDSGYGFENPATREVEVSFQYLSGNIREKLRQAEDNNDDGQYNSNIKALKDIMPLDIPAHLIDFTLGSSWINPQLYDQYVKDRTDIDVTFTSAGGTWFMDAPQWGLNKEKNRAMGVVSTMLHKTIMGHTLIEAAMQNKTITVSQTSKKWDGSTETITDKEATQACAAKIDEIRQDFKDWARQKMQSDPDMAAQMERVYNDTFNNNVPMSIPADFVPKYFGGASHEWEMRPHQSKAIVRGTMQPLLLAHEVGTGKTFTLISIAMEMRRLGTARKPMVVVQNATVGQFVESAKSLYPNAKILTLEEGDRSADGRKNFYAKIKYNDWDMIVVPQSTFEFIPDSEERQMAYIQDKIDEKMVVLQQMKSADANGNSLITRQAEKEIDELETQLAILTNQSSQKRTAAEEKKRAIALQNAEVKAAEMLDRRTDDVENFDDMGIDALLIDEAHEYKHLGFATAMQRGVKGVDPSYSKKSQGVYLKTQAVLEKNNGRNVIFATGTPISNTAAEIWTFMRYLMPADTMVDYGIYYFDDFVRNFGNIQQILEFTTSGKFKESNRFAGYVNLPELIRIWSGVSDTVLTKEAEDVSDKIPEIEGGKAQDIYLPQTRALRSIMKFVKAQLEAFDKMSGKQKKENSHIPLTMYGIAKAAAVDARLVQADAEDDANSKTNEAVRQTLRSLNDTRDYRGTIAIFADNYQNKQSGFNIYEDIRAKLIDQGVLPNEIVVIKPGMTIKKKLEIFDKVNKGEIRVILGSTFTLGTGVNIQERLHTVIHLDAPNRPMDYTQRNGRILRQGNLHKDMNIPVRVLRFGVEDSLDVTAYQRLKTKGAIADSIMGGKQMMANSMINRVLEEEEDVFGDTVAQLSGSEYAMLKNNAEKNVRKYESRRKQWEADQTYIHNAKPRLERKIADADQSIKEQHGYLDDVQKEYKDGKFKSIVIGKNTFNSVDDMAEFIKEYNKTILDEQKQLKDGALTGSQTRLLPIKIDGYTFDVTTTIEKETNQSGGQLFSEVHRKMSYSCPELGLENIPVKQALLRNAIEDITENVITGKDNRENIEALESITKNSRAELKEMQAREGKPFEFDEELAKAKAQYVEYSELMKKEMEEKEAKYAEMDASVEAVQSLAEAEEDGEYRDRVVSYEQQFADLQSEYDALDKNDAKALNEWREKKTGILQSYMNDVTEEFNLPVKESYVYDPTNEDDTKRIYDAYVAALDRRGITSPIAPYEEFNAELQELDAAYREDADIIVANRNSMENSEQDVFEAIMHEQTHGVVSRIISTRALRGVWEEGKAKKPEFASVIENEYKGEGEERWGDEFLTYYLVRTLFSPRVRVKAEAYIKGESKITAEKFVKHTQDLLPLTNDALKQILNFYKDEYQKKTIHGFRSESSRGSEEIRGGIQQRVVSNARTERERGGSERGIRGRVLESANALAASLGVKLNVVDAIPNAPKGVKGRYSISTDQVYFVLPNATSVEDAKRTVLHEVVAHKGLRDVVGRDHFEEFLGKVFRAADTNTRRKIVALAARNGWDFNVATEEYLASLAEQGFDSRENRTFLQKVRDLFMDMFRAAKIVLGFNINDNDMRYMLWRTYQMQRSNGIMSLAEDVVMQRKLGVGNYRNRSMTEREQIIADAKANGTFDPSNDDIRYRVAPSTPSTGEARKLYDDAVRRYTKESNVKRTENFWHHFREAYQDSMLSVQKLMDAVLAETGNKLRGADDVYRAENQLSSKNKAEIEKWERDFMKPLQLEILDLVKNGASYEDIVEYLLAKHGLERNLEFSRREAEEDGKVWDGFVKRDFSGLTELTGEAEHFTEAAQQIVEEFEGKYNTDNLWSKINAATKESLKKSYDSGLMSKETYDKVANMFQYYIPLRGWDNNVAADQYEYMANKGMKIIPALKTAKGRKSRADDPIATLGSMGESSIIQGNRNLMKQKFLNFAQNNPTSLLTISEQWYEQNADGTWRPSNPEIPTDATADEVDAIIKAHEAKMEALGNKATKKRQGLNINLHTTKWEQEEHAVNVKRNGKEYKIFVNGNPIAAQAINGFTNPNANKKDSWEWIEQRATAVKNFMARAFTSMNPAFIFTNLARDLVWAGTSVAIKENAAYARLYSKNISKAMTTAQLPRLVSKWKKGTLDMSNPIEKYFHEFVTNGGETGFTQLNTVDDYKRNMERFIKEAQGGVTTKAKKGWRWIWDNVEFLNRSAEDTTRFMVYLTSRQMGRPITESIANAKDITVNFNKKGRGTMGANVLGFAYIFFNATIQSLANFGKLIANHPKKTAAALTTFGASGMIAPMTALALQAMLSGDDDEPTYWDLPEWVRSNNIVIYVGGSGYVTIPLPHELRPFYGMGELAFSTLMGKEEPEVALQKAVEGFASLMPFDFTGNAGNAIVNFTPTIAQPLVQLVVNKDYFGTPIYRKTAFNEQDPEWTKAYKSTNQLLVDATEFLNELTGGDEVKSGLIDLNPAIIEHLYEGYLGGMGKTINRAAKTLSMLWDEDARTWRNVPVVSSFYQVSDERTSGSQINREYYGVLDEAEQTEHLYRGYNKRAKMGSIEYAEKLNELINSDVFKRYQKVNSYKKAITKLNEALKQADATDREQIETLMMELKVDMLEELEQLNNR